MNKHFVFCHGFGFDRNFWTNLASYFAHETCTYMDLGYFGQSNYKLTNTSGGQLIGIGHSIGLIKLLNLNIKFDYLIALNSFINFLGNDELLRDKRTIELAALKHQFIKNTVPTMQKFYKRCGVSFQPNYIENINITKFLEDFTILAKSFDLYKDTPTLIIGAKDDIIIPPKILHDNFSSYQNVQVKIIDNGKHSLGFTQTAYVASQIMSFINVTT